MHARHLGGHKNPDPTMRKDVYCASAAKQRIKRQKNGCEDASLTRPRCFNLRDITQRGFTQDTLCGINQSKRNGRAGRKQ